MRKSGVWRAFITVLALGLPGQAIAEEALVAAASNFAAPLERLVPAFEKASPHKLKVALGSTGKLYAQIVNGAPFDIFLSADQARAVKLAKSDLVSDGRLMTYAIGRLVLWSPQRTADTPLGPELLKANPPRAIAIAHPELAPYGSAAKEVLNALGLTKSLRDKLVIGENIGQTFAFVGSGSAEAGFVAAAQLADRKEGAEKVWQVPSEMHAPIRQDAVLLKRAEGNPAAVSFFEFLNSAEARTIIKSSGYELD